MKKGKLFLLMVFSMIIGAAFCFVTISDFRNTKYGVNIEYIDLAAEIFEIGELATADYSYTMSNYTEIPKKAIFGLEIPFTGSKVIYSYSGNVKAGLEFSDIKVSINDKEKKVYVSLPAVKILSSEVDYNSLEILDESYSMFDSFTFEDMNLSVGVLKGVAENAAVEAGLLLSAQSNAEKIISASIKAVDDYSKYEVVFY